ncbi:MAG TPA: manganese transporter, partial [Anaerolineae bacterium]|nr:manganese transporter [Anaerolineae bacterium]
MKKIVLAVLTLSLLLSACATETGSNTTNGKLNIVTTTGMIADIVINVGGEHVEVTSLMGPGVDPHLYKASEGDIRRLQEANLIFYNGLHLEAQLGEVLEKMNDFNITTVAVADEIDPAILLSHPQYEDAYDPHIWFDVTLWMQAVRRVQETLSETDPAHKSAYEANATAYLAQLEELHQYVFSQAESIPAEKRVIITAHDAFSYFGRAYGFEVRG